MHVPEGELALAAGCPDAIAADRRADIERHLAACAECQASFDFFASGDDELAEHATEADTWEPLVETATYTALMQYGARVAEEDRDAAVVLKEFLENPIEAAWTTLVTKRRYRTGGVVRALNAAAHKIHKNKPRIALTFAESAVSVAEVLPDDLYPARAVYQLRGAAWKERAKAQLLLGQFPQAHVSLDHAERAYGKTPHNGLGLSLVALLRAGVFYEQGRLDEAKAAAERAERGFAHAGDAKRSMDAAFLRASILFEAGDANGALPIFHRIIEHGENTKSDDWIALGSYAAANCELDRMNLGEASLLFHRALRTFRERGPDRERLLTEWGIARVVLHSGNLLQAVHRLKDTATAFEERGMVTNAALVGLDIAEAQLVLGRHKEIVALAQHLFVVFKDAGMLTGALSAIAYLKEAATDRTLTPATLGELRRFLKRAERQPALQFVRPAIHPEDSV